MNITKVLKKKSIQMYILYDSIYSEFKNRCNLMYKIGIRLVAFLVGNGWELSRGSLLGCLLILYIFLWVVVGWVCSLKKEPKQNVHVLYSFFNVFALLFLSTVLKNKLNNFYFLRFSKQGIDSSWQSDLNQSNLTKEKLTQHLTFKKHRQLQL